MTTVDATTLVSAIQSTLLVPVISHPLGAPKYDLYEAYLFGLCVEAARSIGLDVRHLDATGAVVTSLNLRKSPSAISTPTQNFTHVELSADSRVRLEIHLGIYVRAGSGVSHEGDVVVLDAGEAARARALNTDPRVNKAALVIEAKFHASNIRLRTGREFLGLGVDLGSDTAVFVSSSPSTSVHRLLSYRKRPGHFELIPGAAQEAELRSRIATQLRDYLARTG